MTDTAQPCPPQALSPDADLSPDRDSHTGNHREPRGSKRPKGQEDFLEEAALALRSKAWRPGSMWGGLETQPGEEEPGDLFTPERCAAQPTDPRALMRDLNVVPMALGSYGRFWRGRIRFMLRGSLQS